MAIRLTQQDLRGFDDVPSTIHPHAHHIGIAAAVIGVIGIPLGPVVVPSLMAIILGTVAILLSLHPAPGLNARPEGWVAIVAGFMGLLFGMAQVLIGMSI